MYMTNFTGQDLDFDIKELDNIKFNINDLIDYYTLVEKNFQHLKWTTANTNTLSHKADNVYAWAVQSNLKDTSKPCPPYDIKHDDDVIGTFDASTELLFGFGKIVIDAIPNIRQTVISAHPPGTVIQQHIDNTEFVKVHIPIKTNPNSYFSFGNNNYNLEVGKAYLINTTRNHGTSNNGNSDRIHLIFKIPLSTVDSLINTTWVFDPNQIEFDLLELTNLNFNFDELYDYYSLMQEKFEYLKWTMPDIPDTKLKGIYGYGILTNKQDPDTPLDPPGTRKDKLSYEPLNRPTKMLQGFAKKLFDAIPYMEELVIAGHPSKCALPTHTDKDEHVRIHIPIITNENAYFVIGDNTFVLETRKAYIVNTKLIHSTINDGINDRVHLHFKIPIGKINQFLKNEVTI